jgi:DNA-binding PadR family transcriptional regulator
MLTTISYALLGHLAMRPWTVYDLVQQMQRNVHYFFPRVESQVYAEPKRLVEAGLAVATVEMTGKRKRTVYSITDEGRLELERWLAEPIRKGPLLEFEGLLRVQLAPFGTDEDLASTLLQVREQINELQTLADRIRLEYLEGRAPFQRFVLTRSMLYDFLDSYARLVDDWAERSQERMAAWPEQSEAEREAAALAIFRDRPGET